MVLKGKSLGKMFECQVDICRSFKLTSSPAFFERQSATSPKTLVSNGRHCN